MEFIKELIELLKGSNIKSLKIESDDFKIEIETHGPSVSGVEERTVEKEEIRFQELLPPAEDISKEEKQYHVIKSPLVGTFYRSPAPGAPPFVEVGDIVSPGQVLCIIEALKVMNEIESEVDGVVVRILVENGQPVEYGEPLFLIEPQ